MAENMQDDWEDVPVEDWQDVGEEAPSDVSKTESFLRGGSQGITSGFQDELSARFEQGIAKAAEWMGLQDQAVTDLYDEKTYEDLRDEYRRQNEEASDANPYSYGAGLVTGGVAQAALPGMGAAKGLQGLSKAQQALGAGSLLATQGELAGAGFSEADPLAGGEETQQFIEDVAVGGATNVALGGAIAGAPTVVKGVGTALQKTGGVVKEGLEAVGQSAPAQAIKGAIGTGLEKAGKFAGMDTDAMIGAFQKGNLNQIDLLTQGGQDLLESQSIKASQRVQQLVRGSLNRLRGLKNQQLDAATNSDEILKYVDDALAEAQQIKAAALNPSDVRAADDFIKTLDSYKQAATEINTRLKTVPELQYQPGTKSAQAEVVRETKDLRPQGMSSNLAEVGESGMVVRPVDPNAPGFMPEGITAENIALREAQPSVPTQRVQEQVAPGIVRRTSQIEATGQPTAPQRPLPELENVAPEGLPPVMQPRQPGVTGDGISRQVDTTIRETGPEIRTVDRLVPEQVAEPRQMGARRLDQVKQDAQSYASKLEDQAKGPLGTGDLSRTEKAISTSASNMATQIKLAVQNVVGEGLEETNEAMSKLLKVANDVPSPQEMASAAADPGKALNVKQRINAFLDELDRIPKDSWDMFLPGVDKRILKTFQDAQQNAKILKALRGDRAPGIVSSVVGTIEGASTKLANQAGLATRAVTDRVSRLKEMVSVNPQAFGKYASMLSKSAQQGNSSLAATNYILSQRDPEYRKMIEELDKQQENVVE